MLLLIRLKEFVFDLHRTPFGVYFKHDWTLIVKLHVLQIYAKRTNAHRIYLDAPNGNIYQHFEIKIKSITHTTGMAVAI